MSTSGDDEGITQNWMNRLINILICRGDLAHEKLEAPPVPIKELFRYSTKKDKIFVILGVILAVFVGVLQATTCIVTGYISNLYLMNSDQIGNDALWWSVFDWCIADAVLALVMIVISYLQSYFLLSACSRIVRRIRKEYVKAVLRQDATWFESHDAGLISAQLNNNIERIQDGMADKIGLIVRGFALFIFSTVFAFIVNWRVTLVSLGLGPLGAITMGLMARFTAGPMKDSLAASNEAGSIAEESVMNVKTVAACNGQETMIQKYAMVLEKNLEKVIKLSFLNGFFEGLMFFEMFIFFTAGIFYGVVVYFSGNYFEPGTILMAVNTTQVGGYFLSLLGPHMMAVLKARVAAAVIYETIDRKPKIDAAAQTGKPLKNCRGRIKFEDVHFKYPSRETKILTGCTWEAQAGETIAFVGHSGCGKSTSIGLLTRLYDKCGGEVTIDEIPIEEINLSDLRRAIGIVQQEPCLFNGTIKENIVLGRNITDAKVEEAARIGNAHDFIMKLEHGYDTVLGVGGVALSGGQKQRIAIARAIAADPKILLLDEATSALDTESERIVQLALTKASRGRTTIVIAHRLSTLKDVNRIHVIDKGKVAEIGSHAELIAMDGLYATLAKAQEVGLVSQRRRDSVGSLSQLNIKPITPAPFVRSASIGDRASSTTIHCDSMESDDSTYYDELKEKKPPENPLLRLYLSPEARNLKITTVICCILRGLEMPAYSYLQIFPYTALEQTKDTYMPWLILTTVVFLVLGMATWIVITAAVGFGGWASESTVNSLRIGVLRSLLHSDAEFFDEPRRSNATCVSTLALKSPAVNACLDYRFTLLWGNMIGVIFCLLFTYVNCWQTGITSSILVGLFVVSMSYTSRNLEITMTKKSRFDTTAEFAIEIFDQTKTIQLLSVEDYFVQRYEKQQHDAEPIENKLNRLQSLLFMMTSSYVFISDFFCFLVGASMIYRGEVTSAHAVVAAFTANYAGWSVIFASPTFNDMVKASSAAKSLYDLMGIEAAKIDEGTEPMLEGSISIEKVSFAYPTRPEVKVADGLNLKAGKGEAIALVGASGCGKSTIIQLLERFYTPDGGQIKIDSHNILDVALRHLRRNVALVGQEPVLFRGSVYDNIVLGCEDEVTIDDVKRVAEVANAAKFIEAFPQGYDTDVGEKGRALSGGQKQRVAIARALIRDPKLLLLDEATSALDTESEKKVQKALNEASSGRTSITIAHRLSTIRNANRIYFIENGGVVEYGTHDELIEADGKYARLVEAQALQTD